MIRLAALVPFGETVSGPARQLVALVQALRGVGVPCLVIVFHRRGRPPPAILGALRDADIEHRVAEDRGPADWRMASMVGAMLRDWRPSLVQTHGYKASAVAYLLRKMGSPWPWIGCFHGFTTESLKGRFYHWLDRRLLGAAERIVVMSDAQARMFQHAGRRVRAIYNAALPASPRVGHPDERARLAALTGGLQRPIVGAVGRLSPEKGVDLLLDACGILARDGRALSVLVAGDGPERVRLEAQCRRLGLDRSVRFLGHVADVDVLYRSLDLLVLPSRSEGLPNALLEALQADVPVVATAVGAVPDVVGTSTAVRLVMPGDAAALAASMAHTLSASDSPQAAAARRDIVSRFSLQRRVDAHLQLYQELLDEVTGSTRTCVGSPAA